MKINNGLSSAFFEAQMPCLSKFIKLCLDITCALMPSARYYMGLPDVRDSLAGLWIVSKRRWIARSSISRLIKTDERRSGESSNLRWFDGLCSFAMSELLLLSRKIALPRRRVEYHRKNTSGYFVRKLQTSHLRVDKLNDTAKRGRTAAKQKLSLPRCENTIGNHWKGF